MDEENYQKELFEFEKPKRAFPRLASLLPKGDFEGKVIFSFTFEKMIFIAIGFIMSLVVVFAIGVERGRSNAAKIKVAVSQPVNGIQQPSIERVQKIIAAPQTKNAGLVQHGKASAQPAQKAKVELQPKQSVAATASDSNKGALARKSFTIVAVTCKGKDNALQEISRLKKEGFEASLFRNDKHFFVCVGSFANKDSALKSLNKLKRMYRDAYIVLK